MSNSLDEEILAIMEETNLLDNIDLNEFFQLGDLSEDTYATASDSSVNLSDITPSYLEIDSSLSLSGSLLYVKNDDTSFDFSTVDSKSNFISPVASTSHSEQHIVLAVSPSEMVDEQQVPPPQSRRGRKRELGLSETSLASTSRKAKKPKTYEIQIPLEDENEEQKRLAAIKSKKYRDLQKKKVEVLQMKLEIAEAERDSLKTEVDNLKTRDPDTERDMLNKEIESLKMTNADLKLRLESEKQHRQSVASQVVKILQGSSGI